jgi:hypothetical protein
MNTLKAKTTINCNTCGCAMKRVKSIQVSAGDQKDAIEEAKDKIRDWQQSLHGQNCKVCKTIIKDTAIV